MNLVNWGVWSKRCGPFLWKGTSCGAKLCVPLCDLCASVWATSVWGRRPVWGCVVWGGGRTRWSPHDSQLALGIPPLTMPHKGDLKLPPVTQGDVTTNKINATRTYSKKCHLNGVSNISVWVFAQKEAFLRFNCGNHKSKFWNLCRLSQEVWWRDPGLLKTDGRFSGGRIHLALVSDFLIVDFLIFLCTKSHRTSGTPSQSHWAPGHNDLSNPNV